MGNKPLALPGAIPYQNSRDWMRTRPATSDVGGDVVLVGGELDVGGLEQVVLVFIWLCATGAAQGHDFRLRIPVGLRQSWTRNTLAHNGDHRSVRFARAGMASSGIYARPLSSRLSFVQRCSERWGRRGRDIQFRSSLRPSFAKYPGPFLWLSVSRMILRRASSPGWQAEPSPA
jgi:hypothetical protein